MFTIGRSGIVIFWSVILIAGSRTAPTESELEAELDTKEEVESSEEDSRFGSAGNWSASGFVNCEHVQRLFSLDGSLFKLGKVLDKCWNHGVTLDEINSGMSEVKEREDIENYSYQDLYLPCQDVFGSSFRKLTTRLLHNYIECKEAAALNLRIESTMDWRFVDILEVYASGNKSTTINEQSMVSCSNATKKLALLCRQYGLTEEQWRQGFLRYYYNDKWAVEEDIDELSLTCDQVFNARLHNELYDNPVEQFVMCQKTLPIQSEKRDLFEKKYAEELKEYRALESPNEPAGFDLRAYVSCRHLMVENVASASWRAASKCRSSGLSYEELRAGRAPPDEEDSMDTEGNVAAMYLACADVFNDDLDQFSSGLLGDYEACKEAGALSQSDIRVIQKRFDKLFKLFLSSESEKSNRVRGKLNVTDELVSCSNFTGKLAELCRERGSSLAQELRGFGSLAGKLGKLWLNTEPLDKLYLPCTELLSKPSKYLRNLPIDKYMHCRWANGMNDTQKAFIDKQMAAFFANKHKVNETRYRGDTDVEISSTILFH